MAANTFVIYGDAQDKELTELVPGILPQMGQEALAEMRKLAEMYQSQAQGAAPADDEVPELVETFDA